MRLSVFAFATTLALLAGPAFPQDLPADPEATVVDSLLSSAALKGPPWWKAEKNGKTVYVLGLPTTAPSDLDWDQRLVGWRMNRAQRIIMPAQFKTDVDTKRYNLDAVLTPELAARLEAARVKLKQPEDRYRRISPLAVASRLSDDLKKAASLEWEAGYRGFHHNAALRVFTRKVDTGLWGAAGPLSAEAQLQCLDLALAAVEAGPEAYRKAAEAWAVGDIRGSLSGPRGDRWWRCAAPNMAVIERYVAEIEDAVADRGVEVVVAGIPVHSMVAKDGVVQRLQAAGYQITEPSGLTETR